MLQIRAPLHALFWAWTSCGPFWPILFYVLRVFYRVLGVLGAKYAKESLCIGHYIMPRAFQRKDDKSED